jgi:hypothetical protein
VIKLSHILGECKKNPTLLCSTGYPPPAFAAIAALARASCPCYRRRVQSASMLMRSEVVACGFADRTGC